MAQPARRRTRRGTSVRLRAAPRAFRTIDAVELRRHLLGRFAWSWCTLAGIDDIEAAAAGDRRAGQRLLEHPRYYGGHAVASLSTLLPLEPEETQRRLARALEAAGSLARQAGPQSSSRRRRQPPRPSPTGPRSTRSSASLRAIATCPRSRPIASSSSPTSSRRSRSCSRNTGRRGSSPTSRRRTEAPRSAWSPSVGRFGPEARRDPRARRPRRGTLRRPRRRHRAHALDRPPPSRPTARGRPRRARGKRPRLHLRPAPRRSRRNRCAGRGRRRNEGGTVMRYTLLGRSGLRVSEVALGTMTFGEAWGWGASKEECGRIFDAFVEAGGNFVDTACNYTDGESEEIVGELVESDRDHFVVATKYTLTARRDDPNAGGNHRKNLVRTLEASLRRLRHRLRRPPLAPHVGRNDAGRGGRPRSRRPRLDREGALRRDLRHPRVGRVASGHAGRAAWLGAVRRGPGSVLPPGPRRRARAPADGAVARDDVHVVGHARRRRAHGEVPERRRPSLAATTASGNG